MSNMRAYPAVPHQDTSYILHTQRLHAAMVVRTLAAEASGLPLPPLPVPRLPLNAAQEAAQNAPGWGHGMEPFPRSDAPNVPSPAPFTSLHPPSSPTATGALLAATMNQTVIDNPPARDSIGGAYDSPNAPYDRQYDKYDRQYDSVVGGGMQQALLEPAQLLRFLRIMRPELGRGEVRYIMDHILAGAPPGGGAAAGNGLAAALSAVSEFRVGTLSHMHTYLHVVPASCRKCTRICACFLHTLRVYALGSCVRYVQRTVHRRRFTPCRHPPATTGAA